MSGAQLTTAGEGRLLVRGELDFASVPTLLSQGARCFDAAASPLVLDLSGVTRVNSAGLALLLEWLEQAAGRGQSLVLEHLPQALVDIARMSNVLDLLPLRLAEDGPESPAAG